MAFVTNLILLIYCLIYIYTVDVEVSGFDSSGKTHVLFQQANIYLWRNKINEIWRNVSIYPLEVIELHFEFLLSSMAVKSYLRMPKYYNRKSKETIVIATRRTFFTKAFLYYEKPLTNTLPTIHTNSLVEPEHSI